MEDAMNQFFAAEARQLLAGSAEAHRQVEQALAGIAARRPSEQGANTNMARRQRVQQERIARQQPRQRRLEERLAQEEALAGHDRAFLGVAQTRNQVLHLFTARSRSLSLLVQWLTLCSS